MDKTNIVITNRTSYFNPDVTKVSLSVPNPNRYLVQSSKREGYQIRLYYEFLDTIKKDGQVFYYTLTYNNIHLPTYEGIRCFDYEHLKYLLNGGFKKMLNRKYHCRLKYFVGAELGEGAGSRGLHNNPHYHILFYLTPLDDQYVKISPVDFRHLVRLYWQGFDEDFGFRSYRSAKFGIAKEGENLGLVTDCRACLYVSKYVTKDAFLKRFEYKLKKTLYKRYFESLYNDDDIRREYLFTFVLIKYYPFSEELPSSDDVFFQFRDLCSVVAPNLLRLAGDALDKDFLKFFDSFLKESNLESDYKKFVDSSVFEKVRLELNVFRNRFSNKCRISQGVGDLALQNIDFLNPVVKIPLEKDLEYRLLPNYYFRKLFYNVVKNPDGNNCYVLNSRGVDFKVYNLKRSMYSLESRLKSYLFLVENDSSFTKLKKGFIYNDVDITNYVAYKLIYEGRLYRGCPSIDYFKDYEEFISRSYSFSVYCPNAVSSSLETCLSHGYRFYSYHIAFRDKQSLFSYFDSLLEYFTLSRDNKLEADYLELCRVRDVHKKLKLSTYLTNL